VPRYVYTKSTISETWEVTAYGGHTIMP